jgi:hypothetical protein
MIHVPNVQLKLLFPTQSISTIHLCPARHARLHLVTAALNIVVPGEVLGQQRAWTDEVHVTFEHVPKLWQFIDAGPSHEAADAGKAIAIGEHLPAVAARICHGAKLDHFKWVTLETDSSLAKQYRAGRSKANRQGDDGQERRQYSKRACGNEAI